MEESSLVACRRWSYTCCAFIAVKSRKLRMLLECCGAFIAMKSIKLRMLQECWRHPCSKGINYRKLKDQWLLNLDWDSIDFERPTLWIWCLTGLGTWILGDNILGVPIVTIGKVTDLSIDCMYSCPWMPNINVTQKVSPVVGHKVIQRSHHASNCDFDISLCLTKSIKVYMFSCMPNMP